MTVSISPILMAAEANTSHDNSTDAAELAVVPAAISLLLISLFITSGNGLVIATKFKQPQLLVGSETTTLLLVNLAVCDLLVGAFLTSIILYVVVDWKTFSTDYWTCYSSIAASTILLGTSSILLLLVAADRCLWIYKPFWHERIFTPKMARLCVTSGVFFLSLLAASPFFGWNTWDEEVGCNVSVFALGYTLLSGIVDAVCLGGTIIFNVLIYRMARAQSRQINNQQTTMGSTVSAHVASTPQRKQQQQSGQGGRAGAVIATVVAANVLCSAPHIFAYITLRLSQSDGQRVILGTLLIRLCNSGINPIIYYMMMPAMRKAMRTVMCPAMPGTAGIYRLRRHN